MPLIRQSTYRRSPLLRNGHLETIYPALFRKIEGADYERERLTLSDGDFVDLDWLDGDSRRLILLTHGLEGNSGKQYVKGMAKFFYREKKWDVLAWNCRSCSGEMNRARRLYHHGEIGDIGEVIGHALRRKNYHTVVLAGFSMGGNISMKYLGVQGRDKPEPIRACIAFSSPTDLEAGAEILNDRSNFIYRRRFLHYLKIKLVKKNEQYPGLLDLTRFKNIKTWRDFDDFFSAPLTNMEDAAAFYRMASAKNFMAGTDVPTLLVSAKNDPILPPQCYPKDVCERHPKLFLEMPEHGGHVGFWRPGDEYAWSERRAAAFLDEVL